MTRAAAAVAAGATATIVALVSSGLALSGCERQDHGAAQPAPRAPHAAAGPVARPGLTARSIDVDGVKLGDDFGRLVHRAPYNVMCDDDPIDEAKTRRALVYGALPCRGNAFPGGTTVVFFIDWADHDNFDQPIRGIGWMGGHYFDSRSNFPLRVGTPATDAARVLGPVRERVVISQHSSLTAWRFDGDIYALVDGSLLAGFVLGPMPADTSTDAWRVYEQMYRKYTRPVGMVEGAAVSREDCKRVLDHADQLMGQDPKHQRLGSEEAEINECRAHATPAMIQCALAAKTWSALEACEKPK